MTVDLSRATDRGLSRNISSTGLTLKPGREAGRGLCFALVGPFGLGNLGDAAIQDSVVQAIRTRLPGARIRGISLNPTDTEQRHGVPSFPIRRQSDPKFAQSGSKGRARVHALVAEAAFILRSFAVIRGCSHVVVSGGGQLDDVWGGAREHPYALFKWSLLARLARARLVYLSVGAGPLDESWSRRLVRAALGMAGYRSYRDEESREFVRALGVLQPGGVYPDLAFGLAPVRGRSEPDGRLTVAMAPLPFRSPRVWPDKDGAAYTTYVGKLAEFAAWLVQQGYRVEFLPCSIGMDRAVIADLLAEVSRQAPASAASHLIVPRIDDVASLCWHLAQASVVITSRFHGALLAFLHGRPAIALSYHPKLDVLMRSMGQQEYCLNIADFTVEALRHSLASAVARREEIAGCLRERVAERRQKVEEQFDRVFAPVGV